MTSLFFMASLAIVFPPSVGKQSLH